MTKESKEQGLPHFIRFSDEHLFGSETADTEDPDDLEEYFVESEDFKRFLEEDRAFAFVRARKGVGKSALLKHSYNAFSRSGYSTILLTGGRLLAFGELSGKGANELLRDWREILCRAAIEAIAPTIAQPKSAAELALVRKAKPLGGSNNSISQALGRLSLKLPFIGAEDLANSSSADILSQYLTESKSKVALLIDDIDATFQPSEREMSVLGAFFTAARLLSGEMNGLRVRA